MGTRHLPFPQQANSSVAVADAPQATGSFVCIPRPLAQQIFALSWEAMQEIYQLAMQQTMAMLRRKSVLDLRPSMN